MQKSIALKMMVKTAISGNLQLRAGSQSGALLLRDADGLQDAVSVTLEVQRDTGECRRSDSDERHGDDVGVSSLALKLFGRVDDDTQHSQQ